jgi:hypothetical protein
VCLAPTLFFFCITTTQQDYINIELDSHRNALIRVGDLVGKKAGLASLVAAAGLGLQVWLAEAAQVTGRGMLASEK